MSYQPPQEYKYLFKITVYGEEGVGKTHLLSRWVDPEYSVNYPKTIGVEFKTKMIDTQFGKVKLQIWDTAGDVKYRSIISSYMRGTHFIFIILSADATKQQKKDQINKWLTFIAANNTAQIKVAIIETKSDLNTDTMLSNKDLEQFEGRYDFHQTFSAKTGVGIDTLESNLKLTVSQLIEQSQKIEPISASTFSINMNNLSDEQAKTILTSLKNLLIHGPLNEASKSYHLSLFGGGKYVLGENGVSYIVPDHADNWISKIHLTLTNNYLQSSSLGTEAPLDQLNPPTQPKTLLSQLFQHFKDTALKKPFSRSSTTQDFYENCLPGFINYCISNNQDGTQHNYFSVWSYINTLNDVTIRQLLQNFKHVLETGYTRDPKKPYDIGFFGGKKHLVDQDDAIKVPDHIASLLNYIAIDLDTVTQQNKLMMVYNYLIMTQYSKCTSRSPDTQSFYNNLVKTFINHVTQASARPAQSHLVTM